MEAGVGVEPTRSGFADRGLPTWLPRRYRSATMGDSAEIHNGFIGSLARSRIARCDRVAKRLFAGSGKEAELPDQVQLRNEGKKNYLTQSRKAAKEKKGRRDDWKAKLPRASAFPSATWERGAMAPGGRHPPWSRSMQTRQRSAVATAGRERYLANWAKIPFASSSVSLLPMSNQVPGIGNVCTPRRG